MKDFGTHVNYDGVIHVNELKKLEEHLEDFSGCEGNDFYRQQGKLELVHDLIEQYDSHKPSALSKYIEYLHENNCEHVRVSIQEDTKWGKAAIENAGKLIVIDYKKGKWE
jgi:hypothetical protein